MGILGRCVQAAIDKSRRSISSQIRRQNAASRETVMDGTVTSEGIRERKVFSDYESSPTPRSVSGPRRPVRVVEYRIGPRERGRTRSVRIDGQAVPCRLGRLFRGVLRLSAPVLHRRPRRRTRHLECRSVGSPPPGREPARQRDERLGPVSERVSAVAAIPKEAIPPPSIGITVERLDWPRGAPGDSPCRRPATSE